MHTQNCPRCGHEVTGIPFSCPECGTLLPYTCPFCGKKHTVVPKCCSCRSLPNDPTIERFLVGNGGNGEALVRRISEAEYQRVYEEIVDNGKLRDEGEVEYGEVKRTDNVTRTGYYLLKQTEQPLVDEMPQTFSQTIYLTRAEFEEIDQRVPEDEGGSNRASRGSDLANISCDYYKAVDE